MAVGICRFFPSCLRLISSLLVILALSNLSQAGFLRCSGGRISKRALTVRTGNIPYASLVVSSPLGEGTTRRPLNNDSYTGKIQSNSKKSQPDLGSELYLKTVDKNQNLHEDPEKNLTQAQIAFGRINFDPQAFVEFISQPAIQNNPEVRDSFIVNLDGRPLTCEDICSQPGTTFGLVGLCTRDFCVCNPDLDLSAHGDNGIAGYEPQRHAREQRCPEGEVYDGVALRCSDPRKTVMCDDYHQPLNQQGQSSQVGSSSSIPAHVSDEKFVHQYPKTVLLQLQPAVQTAAVSSIPAAPVISSYNHVSKYQTVHNDVNHVALVKQSPQLYLQK